MRGMVFIVTLFTSVIVFVSCGNSTNIERKATEIFGPAAQTDKCGPENSFIASLVPEKWNGLCGIEVKSVSYSDSCNNHDSCYDSAGAVRELCDQTFLKNLQQSCQISYAEMSCKPSLDLCRGVAQNYFDAVRSQGEEAFRQAQN